MINVDSYLFLPFSDVIYHENTEIVPPYCLKIQDIELRKSNQEAYLSPCKKVALLLKSWRLCKCTRKAISSGLDIPDSQNTTLTTIAPFIGNLPV